MEDDTYDMGKKLILLIELVKEHGDKCWSHIAMMLEGRVGKQCRERWHNHLRPYIKKEKMTEQEEIMLIAAHQRWGNKWATIAKQMPGRTENAIKNHFNATKRRLLTKGKSKPSTCLEEYIQNLPPEYLKADFPESLSSQPVTQMVGASSNMVPEEQMGPHCGADEALNFLVDEKMLSHGYSLASTLNEIPNDYVEDESNASNLGLPMEFNVENDGEFLEFAGWNLAAC